MLINEEIQSLLDKLTATYLTKGVQPSEISDAIFEKSYQAIEVSKQEDLVYYDISFLEDDDDGLPPAIHKMRYIYNLERYLLRVEQKVGRKKYVQQWDREVSIKEMICSLSSLLLELNDEGAVNCFIKTLPDDLYQQVSAKVITLAA
ncbi:hypothetical protein [Algicola sagamiensis]|uniref:hypothetical protein n=1 Tax=Algicola sagamiensis TaxID=163869 RepID=UPI000369FE62|nr:hypothetical protein [Algicola sagamiensis]